MAGKTTLRQYIEFLSGNADPETFERIRDELEDPESASSRFFRGMGQATEDPFGWGRPLFGPGDVLEDDDELGNIPDRDGGPPRS